MHLVLIRHAQSLNNVLYAQTGGKEGRHPDPPLSDVGFEQARLLGEAANRIPHLGSLTHLYSSLTTRAVQTAAPLATALALPVQGTDTLHEIGGLYLGQLTGPRTPTAGQTRQALQRICPELRWPAPLDGRAAWDGGFEANDEQVYAARARTVLNDLRARHAVTDRVGLVTHQNFAQFLLAALLGSPLSRLPAKLVLHNTATCELELGPRGTRLLCLNRHDHLPGHLVTN
ncbi:histidine phosphatase family protein [Deinococcus sp. ME38]|uniref:histidine phosphatase family protein n=1 Tax=Deinococcus sp. ME38 TaxID=3400344 RepID=UPI003B5A913B